MLRDKTSLSEKKKALDHDKKQRLDRSSLPE